MKIQQIGGQEALTIRVRKHLEDLIRSGSLPPGSKLPKESELTAMLDVSRPTLREALHSLEYAGAVVRRRGVGTFVRDIKPLRNNLNFNFGVTDLIEGLGCRPGSTGVKISQKPASEIDSQQLHCDPGEPLLCVQRIRTADDTPVVYAEDVAPLRLLDTEPNLSDEQPSIYSLLHRQGVKIRSGIARVVPVVADAPLAKKLAVNRGAPLLLLDQIDYGVEDRPVLHSREWHVADAFEITVHRQGPD